MINEDTICAPATGTGGALALIRISGPDCFRIAGKIFYPSIAGVSIAEQKGYKLVRGEIRDGDKIIDEVIVSIFRSPHSYTGEDSIEVSCHASTYIVTGIMRLLTGHGARAAHPGEFTRRAFINGKMDLSQAEAVADIIAAGSRAAHKIAMNQLRGGFSVEISRLRDELLRFSSLIELELDFGEEDVEFADRKELKEIVTRVKALSDRLASSFSLGNAIKNGVPVAIVGKPNSGKSTLLNALLNEEKAIVSDIPGTTRDVIEDTIVVNGLEYRFIDTAGLRDTKDVLENLGIRKTYEKIMIASVILLVDEAEEQAENINRRIAEIRDLISGHDKKLIIVINKTDRCSRGQIDKLAGEINKAGIDSLIFISAKEQTGFDELKGSLGAVAEGKEIDQENVIISNIRHYEALNNVSLSLGRVIRGLEEMIPGDLVATDIRQAIHFLGEITGEITTDEILGNIFKNFCIGK